MSAMYEEQAKIISMFPTRYRLNSRLPAFNLQQMSSPMFNTIQQQYF